MTSTLSEKQIGYLQTISNGYPEPVTIYNDGDHLSALIDADLIEQYDMWPDGTRRWIITQEGRAALTTIRRTT